MCFIVFFVFFFFFFFFFNDTATTEIYTLSLHDALPIEDAAQALLSTLASELDAQRYVARAILDRKSTRLNSRHITNSYADFCLKKKKRRSAPRCPERNQRKNHWINTKSNQH